METIIKKTKKFGKIGDKTYFMKCNNSIHEVRFDKATITSFGTEEGYGDFRYEIASVGTFDDRNMPTVYESVEDLLANKNPICFQNHMALDMLFYCEENELLSLKVSNSMFNSHYYIKSYFWDGFKVCHSTSSYLIRVVFDCITGELNIITQDNYYRKAEDCKANNEIKIYRFAN